MKSRICALMFIGILSVSLQGYAQTENSTTALQEIKQETQELLQSIGAYTVDQKDAAVKKAKEGLNNLDRRLDALEAKIDKDWEQMDLAARKKARASLNALRQQRNKAAEWYGSLQTGTENAWEQMKQGFADAYQDFNAAWEKSDTEYGPDQ